MPLFYTSLENQDRSNTYISVNLSWQHKFKTEGHEINAQLDYRQRDGDETSTDELLDENGLKVSGRRAYEGGPSQDVRAKLDYTLPLNEDKFESGYEGEFDREQENTNLSEYDPTVLIYIPQFDYAHKTQHECDIHALYILYSGKLGQFGYQGGFRGEYTWRIVELLDESQRFLSP